MGSTVAHGGGRESEFPYNYTNNGDYGLEAWLDMWLLAESDHMIGTLSSHFSAVPALLRFTRGWSSNPLFLDRDGVANQSFQIGLLRLGNLGRRGSVADRLVPQRFQLIAERFLQLRPELVPHFVASFAIDPHHGLPTPSWHVFDIMHKHWMAGGDTCPREASSHAEGLHQGLRLFKQGKVLAAQACWREALASPATPP